MIPLGHIPWVKNESPSVVRFQLQQPRGEVSARDGSSKKWWNAWLRLHAPGGSLEGIFGGEELPALQITWLTSYHCQLLYIFLTLMWNNRLESKIMDAYFRKRPIFRCQFSADVYVFHHNSTQIYEEMTWYDARLPWKYQYRGPDGSHHCVGTRDK